MFVCQSVEHDTNESNEGNVRLTAITNDSELGKKYFAYTPYGELTMGILNPDAFKQFKPGKNYRVTIEEYEE